MPKKTKKKRSAPLTAAEILVRVRAEEAERQVDGRREISQRRRNEIKQKQRAAALRLWAPNGRLRKLQKERKKQAQRRLRAD